MRPNRYHPENPIILSILIQTPEQASFIALVDAILAAKAADSGAETADLEEKLDERVYAWYNLTQDEISVVEEEK